ncbi:OLC1v1020473C1 [Oldenlandia corymbosa var. corymbosa]|uniref:OLC1v1020473C1 n=1 Tax=Oldenlandia corymbosa var. corymbosa TaxID=529605 RepID=A0AAV1EH18_OLDCO|nr:OLC1v1020473C1 [Oldenlandia corymbosa var. corymbosa]
MVLTAASKVSRLTIVQFILLVAVVFLSPTVRSSSPEFDPLRLPTDNDGGDDSHICPQSAGPDSCPVRCFRTDPVCGVDGVTYWCGCADAHCAGTRVAKLGFCEVGIGGFGYGSGAGSVTGQALLLVHIVWLILLGIFVLFGFL